MQKYVLPIYVCRGRETAGHDPQIAKAMLPLEVAIAQYHLIPVKVIEPPQNLYDTLDFKPDLIAQAIQMGRNLVNDRWAELEQFLGV